MRPPSGEGSYKMPAKHVNSTTKWRCAASRFKRYLTLLCLICAIATSTLTTNAIAEQPPQLIDSISKQTLWRNRDGNSQTWFHPRVCMMPGPDGKPVALMTLQVIGGSDYFGPVHWSQSTDLGKTWSEPQPIAGLGRDPVAGRSDGLKAGVCDVVPQYHPQTDSVLALGHVVFYKGAHFARKEQLARYPVYVTRNSDGEWSDRKIMNWDDPRGAFIYTNNCGQRVVTPDGDVQMSFTFGPQASNRMVAGVQASFDGQQLKIKEVGPALHNPKGRGLLEPSVTQFGDTFWMTMRAEDNRGYVSVSDDGLNWDDKQAWTWEDGTPLGMSTTQQHWLTHSDGLFLVYTRKDASNKNVMRWRSPLWVAQVDTAKRCLIKSSERVVLPLVGDGVNDPNNVAIMGNFHVTHASPDEAWVTVGEWMPRGGYKGDVLLARIRWSKPNRLPLW
ncbi:sialidase family protein [Roseimaritima ulvae]|nr:sialidase family protein [Roseimaritima ulvae]